MTGSEFQEIWRYIETLVKRIEVLEKQVEALPKYSQMSEALERELADIAWDKGGD